MPVVAFGVWVHVCRECVPSSVSHPTPNGRAAFRANGYASLLLSPAKFLLHVLPTVKDRDDLNGLTTELVDQSVPLDDQFAQGFVLDFGDLPAHSRIFGEGLDGSIELVDDDGGVLRRGYSSSSRCFLKERSSSRFPFARSGSSFTRCIVETRSSMAGIGGMTIRSSSSASA